MASKKSYLPLSHPRVGQEVHQRGGCCSSVMRFVCSERGAGVARVQLVRPPRRSAWTLESIYTVLLPHLGLSEVVCSTVVYVIRHPEQKLDSRITTKK